MRKVSGVLAVLLAGSVMAGEPKSPEPETAAPGTTIKQTDRYGNVQHHKPSWVVKDHGRIVEINGYGTEQPQKPGFKATGDRVSRTDNYGTVQHDKPSGVVEQDGRIVETDRYGNRQYHKPGFQVQADEVYQTDRYGNRGNQTYEVKGKASPQVPANSTSRLKSSGKLAPPVDDLLGRRE